jgi:hypothetical protein
MIDVMQAWLRAGRQATLDGIALMPRRAESMSAAPLFTTGAQGSAYYLVDDSDRGWVLKKFSAGWQPGAAYTEAVQTLVPREAGFEAGFERMVLKSSSVSAADYCDAEFRSWLDGAILMRQVAAPTWAESAASIKDGATVLPKVERLFLCRKLSEKVEWLEAGSLAHRDLSCTNLMLDALNVDVHLIDWDSLYHPTLTPPPNAACGTRGYAAPFAKVDGVDEAGLTWCEGADRFALTILNAEILTMNTDSTLTGYGGLFEQEDLDRRSGRSVLDVRNSLRRAFPAAVKLLEEALIATRFEECPAPSRWIEFVHAESPNSAGEVWGMETEPDEDFRPLYPQEYEPHFVGFNRAAVVQVDKRVFVKAPSGRRR